MLIPYSCLHITANGITIAARGGLLHTFRDGDSTPVASWNHPDLEKHRPIATIIEETQDTPTVENTRGDSNEITQEEASEPSVVSEEQDSKSQPPAKRQRCDTEQRQANSESSNAASQQAKKKNKKIIYREAISTPPDRPIITLLTGTSDSAHIVAVSGHDKSIWVFALDATTGSLTQTSRRVMPKRPCSIDISADNKVLICADKFGDVYALPLLPNDHVPVLDPKLSLAVKHVIDRPAATALTVHSAGNLKALREQERQMELRKQRLVEEEKKNPSPSATSEASTNSPRQANTVDAPPAPSSEHILLLGHVSMLTAVLVAQSPSSATRSYIITADRDEHIRVSRYPPQSYVIETFCLGHTDFVQALAIPSSHPHLLISGGGEDALFLWAWETGTLLAKTPIPTAAATVATSQKLAVSRLVTASTANHGTFVFAICEGIAQLYQWHLDTTSMTTILTHPNVIPLPTCPSGVSATAGRVTVALDYTSTLASETAVASPATAPGLLVYEPVAPEESWRLATTIPVTTALATTVASDALPPLTQDVVLDLSSAEIKKLLYTVESLRKKGPEIVETEEAAEADAAI